MSKFTKYAYLKSLHGREIKPSHYRVLVTMLDYANADGTSSHRGAVGLAADCDMHVETVKKAIQWLRKEGYVIEVHRGFRYGGASIYNFPLRAKGSLETSLEPVLKEVENRESPGFKGSPQASPPKEDQENTTENPGTGHAMTSTMTSTAATPPGANHRGVGGLVGNEANVHEGLGSCPPGLILDGTVDTEPCHECNKLMLTLPLPAVRGGTCRGLPIQVDTVSRSCSRLLTETRDPARRGRPRGLRF